jgi:hypothetical protein
VTPSIGLQSSGRRAPPDEMASTLRTRSGNCCRVALTPQLQRTTGRNMLATEFNYADPGVAVKSVGGVSTRPLFDRPVRLGSGARSGMDKQTRWLWHCGPVNDYEVTTRC